MNALAELNLEIKNARAQQTKQAIIKKSFTNLLFVSIAEKLAYFFNPFIDSAIVGIFLDSSIQAAMGYFVPIITIISLVWVVIMGVQILCAQYRGRGDGESLQALFDSAILFLGVAAVIVSAGFFFGRAELAWILGAKAHTAIILQEYIAGYSLSIIGQALYPLLLWFLNFNGDDKISKYSIALMSVLNLVFDMLLAVWLNMGAFGLGLATSLSYLLTCAYVLRTFLVRYGWGQTNFANIRWGELAESAKIGKPSLMFNLGITLKAYIMNLTLINSVGDSAIMVMSVQGTFCGMLGAIPAGHVDAFGSLGSVHYAAKDKIAFVKVARFALKSCIIFSGIAMLSLMFASNEISSIYFQPPEEAWTISNRMLWIFPSFLVLNGICGIFMRAYNLKEEYRTQHKDAWLVDGMPLFENLLMAGLSVAFMPFIGSDAVWLSFPATEIVCLIIIAANVFKDAGRVTFKLDDWLKVDKKFGKVPALERAFYSPEEVFAISEEVVKFCNTNKADSKISTFAGVVTEELLNNVIIHGRHSKELCTAYIRATFKDDLSIRIYDDNRAFNPRKEMQKIISEPERPGEEKIGLRLVKSITDKYGAFDYQNTAGINTSIINLRSLD
ncbi:MAG: hypothetical protein SR1Q5_04820 [Quinella sp. 1Q5]|nr:hypothetical protein [Quinella sp. 1Q5]